MADENSKIEYTTEDVNFKSHVVEIIQDWMREEGFSHRKITDTPTDDLAMPNRKYVNMFGSVSGRPQMSVIGQQYFATDLGYPIFRNSNNAWVSATGSVVG